MRPRLRFTIVPFALALSVAPVLHAQAVPTAEQSLHLSTFAGATGTYTGLGDSRNAGITVGVDLGLRAFYHFKPGIELRGTYPIADGRYAAEKNILGGVKVERPIFQRYHPYVDFLYGRGELDFQNGGYPSLDGFFYYVQNPSNVMSPGAGVDFDLSHHFAAKADFQLQRYNTPVTASGHLNSKATTIGLVYRFDFNGHHSRIKQWAPPPPPRQQPAPSPDQPVAPPPA